MNPVKKEESRIATLLQEEMQLITGKTINHLSFKDQIRYARINKEIATLSYQCYQRLKQDKNYQKQAIEHFLKAFDLCFEEAKNDFYKALEVSPENELLPFEETDADKLYKNGMAYLLGAGCRQNTNNAHMMIKMSAEKNHPGAMSILATIYERGYTVKRDLDTAQNLYRESAQLGNPRAQTQLAFHLRYCKDKKAERMTWLQLAVKSNYADALFDLGKSTFKDKNNLINFKSLRLCKIAAELGQSKAGTYLGRCYNQINNIIKNKSTGLRFLRLAAEQGNLEANLRFRYTLHESERCVATHKQYHKYMLENEVKFAATLIDEYPHLQAELDWDVERSQYDSKLRQTVETVQTALNRIKTKNTIMHNFFKNRSSLCSDSSTPNDLMNYHSPF